jgi:hypothetical protein
MGKQLVSLITCGCESSAPFLSLMSGEQSWRFATVNDDEFNRILTEKAGLCLIQCHIIKQLMTFNFGEYKD